VLSQLIGAVVRAIIVLLVVATPSLILPGTTAEGAQMVTLVGLALAGFVAMEYGATYPALVEFRDAPPFNRVRALTLMLTLFSLSVVIAGGPDSSLALVLRALGLVMGAALDFPWSPMTVILDRLPDGMAPVSLAEIKVMVGLTIFIMLGALAIFALLLRLRQWPNREMAFNVWINLPTFDPTAGGDVVKRLKRDARINIILGFALLFVVPIIAIFAARHMGMSILGSHHTMVWGIALWMFLPLSLFMRGLAMGRIADMITNRRARLVAAVAADAPRTAY